MQADSQAEIHELRSRLSRSEEERDRVRLELESRPDPERLHHMLLYGLPFFLGGMAAFQSPRFSLGELFGGAGLLVATWAIVHRFYKYREQGGYEVAAVLAGVCFSVGALVGNFLAGVTF